MDVVVLFNGLGNQMSQYSFYLAKKAHNRNTFAIFDYDCSTNHNGYELDKVFNIKLSNTLLTNYFRWIFNFYKKGTKIQRKIKHLFLRCLGIRMVSESLSYKFNKQLLYNKSRVITLYKGGWHSEKYFKEIENIVLHTFQFPEDTNKTFMAYKSMIGKAENSVSIHVRRGDYLKIKEDDYYQFGGVCTLEYYERAIKYLRNKYLDCHFFVFSDDLEWCKQVFGTENFDYIEGNHGELAWRDMCLMSLCKHHIVANSTFSWWGARLSKYNGETIRPKWFIRNIETPDFYPECWTEL